MDLLDERLYVLRTSAELDAARMQNWHGTPPLYVRYAAKWVVKRQKYIIYVLSVLRFIISHQLRSLQTQQQWFRLKVHDMPASHVEVDHMVKCPAFQYRFSRHNYQFWKHQFSKDPSSCGACKGQDTIDIEMSINDSSSDLTPTYPAFHSIVDRLKRSLLNYKYASWVRRLDYDPANYASKYFSQELTHNLYDEFRLSPMWANFINDSGVDLINCLCAVTTGYFRTGAPCFYLNRQFLHKEQTQFQNASRFVSKRKSFSPLTLLGSQLLKFKANTPALPRQEEGSAEFSAEHAQREADGESDNSEIFPGPIPALVQSDNVLPLAQLWEGEVTPFYKPPMEPLRAACPNDENLCPF